MAAKRKPKITLATKVAVVAAIILAIILLTGGVPDIAEFSAVTKAGLIKAPTVTEPPPSPLPLPTKPKPPLCFEGDKGLDAGNASFCKYATRVTNNGYTVYYSSPLYDSCVDESTVLEYFCTSPTTARCHAEDIPCGPDGICKNGACITPTTRFAYRDTRDDRIYIIDALDDGTPVRAAYPVTTTRQPGWIADNPALSHKSRQLAFEVISSNSSARGIYLLDLSCPEPACLATQLLSNGAANPEFSPDDTKLLYHNRTDYSIWVYDFSTSTSTLALARPELRGTQTWSNSGANITFAKDFAASMLYSIPANCNNACTPKALVQGGVPRGYWRGTNVAYQQSFDVKVVRFDGSSSRTVIGGFDPVWSPNGAWIAYQAGWIYRVNSDCSSGIGCNVTLVAPIGNGVKMDWQRLA